MMRKVLFKELGVTRQYFYRHNMQADYPRIPLEERRAVLKKKAKALYAEGYNVKQLVKILGVSTFALSATGFRVGRTRILEQYKKNRAILIEKAEELKKEGIPLKEIADRLKTKQQHLNTIGFKWRNK